MGDPEDRMPEGGDLVQRLQQAYVVLIMLALFGPIMWFYTGPTIIDFITTIPGNL